MAPRRFAAACEKEGQPQNGTRVPGPCSSARGSIFGGAPRAVARRALAGHLAGLWSPLSLYTPPACAPPPAQEGCLELCGRRASPMHALRPAPSVPACWAGGVPPRAHRTASLPKFGSHALGVMPAAPAAADWRAALRSRIGTGLAWVARYEQACAPLPCAAWNARLATTILPCRGFATSSAGMPAAQAAPQTLLDP